MRLQNTFQSSECLSTFFYGLRPTAQDLSRAYSVNLQLALIDIAYCYLAILPIPNVQRSDNVLQRPFREGRRFRIDRLTQRNVLSAVQTRPGFIITRSLLSEFIPVERI